jgi:Zinc carboxypeptidase
MARPLMRSLLAVTALIGARCAFAACVIDVTDEITNPFEPGCGDVIFTYTQTDDAGTNIALGFTPPVPVDSLTPVDGFRTYATLHARHQALMNAHDEIAGQIVGATVANRSIWAYVVGDADATTPDGAPEGAVLVNGGIHAREWQTPEAVTAVLETLAERKSNRSLEQYLIENLTTVIVPVNNIDGFIQTQTHPISVTAHREQPREGRMRRKNLRNPNTQAAIDSDITTVADNFWGIDLNRNSSQGFAQANRSSGSVTSLIYRGVTPATEPEIQALQQAATLGPAARLRFYSDTHSFGQVLLAPTTGNVRRNAITEELAARMRAASERFYQYGADPPGSQGIGTTADHFAFTYQIPTWTFELEPASGAQDYGGLATHGHSGFILPDREVARMRTDVARMYLLGFYRQSGPPALLAVQIRDAQTSEIVYDARWNMSSPTARTQSVAVNRALLPGRSYRLWLAFNKPMRVRDANGAVTAYRGQTSGAGLGQASLQSSLLATPLDLTGGAWLNQPGGAPNGYLRYADDAYTLEFTLPASLAPSAATGAALRFAVRDLADMAVDGNPATPVDWSSGHWSGYDGLNGAEDDAGGADCTFKPFIAAQADASPPAQAGACASTVAPPPPPPAPPPPSSGRSGGGGAPDALLLLALALMCARRARKGTAIY